MGFNKNRSDSIFEIITFQGIVLFHLNRCVVNGSVEWHGGYWIENSQTQDKTYVQNSREVFSNSVKMLKALLVPHFDILMKDNNKKINIKLKKLYNKFKEQNNDEYNKEDYLNDRIKIYTILFEKLNGLLKRKNYMESEMFGDADIVEDKEEGETHNKDINDVSDFEENEEETVIEKDNNVSIEEDTEKDTRSEQEKIFDREMAKLEKNKKRKEKEKEKITD